MPDQLTDSIRKAAEEIVKAIPFDPVITERMCYRCLIKVDDVAAIIEREMAEMVLDMQRVRVMLRKMWQIHDLGGESHGRSWENEIVELASALLDYHFPRNDDMCKAFDADSADGMMEIYRITVDRRLEEMKEAAPCQKK